MLGNVFLQALPDVVADETLGSVSSYLFAAIQEEFLAIVLRNWLAVVGHGIEEQILLIGQSRDAQTRQHHDTMCAQKILRQRSVHLNGLLVKLNLGIVIKRDRQSGVDDILRQGVVEAIWDGIAVVFQHGVFAFALASYRNPKHKGVLLVVEDSFFAEHELRKLPEDMLVTIEKSTRCIMGHAKMFLHIDVEVFEHLRAHLIHALVDLLLHLVLKLLEG